MPTRATFQYLCPRGKKQATMKLSTSASTVAWAAMVLAWSASPVSCAYSTTLLMDSEPMTTCTSNMNYIATKTGYWACKQTDSSSMFCTMDSYIDFYQALNAFKSHCGALSGHTN
ncbi:hypothetical protein FA10DRAFT_280653 [Acaromyces ingoldii]|uniref:Uncharacterized protein n=1 Tax=Acaromyces ingoldii TaxID=215250 RepID=A0A316YKJ6_9BASI|nr:hypothetical protein FA10DRAFT_280653 [Acaromyces ingoldii]PWN89712.1 hypothetical protein FA10DRAFT_280653 [Acaromyces ingoldii]